MTILEEMLGHEVHGIGFDQGVLHFYMDDGKTWEFTINGEEISITVWPEETNCH